MRSILLALLLAAAPALAQDPGAAPAEPDQELPVDLPPPGPPPAPADVERLTHEVASGLRCPVCQGLSVADSPSHTAVAMKERVRFLVQSGYPPDQIDAYFVARYGEWVLLAPPASGLTWALWLGPAALLGAGALYAFGSTLRRAPANPTPADPTPKPEPRPGSARYQDRLLSEMEDDAP